jgi:hypothetical protein
LRANSSNKSNAGGGASGGGSLADAMGMDMDTQTGGGGSQFSLAHELAAALMPEPSAGSALLDEFGIEYDEGAEGIDAEQGDLDNTEHTITRLPDIVTGAGDYVNDQDYHGSDPAFAPSNSLAGLGFGGMARSTSLASEVSDDFSSPYTDVDSSLGSPLPKRRTPAATAAGAASPPPTTPRPRDPMDVLNQDLAATETFLTHLRRIDVDNQPSASTSTLNTASPSVYLSAASSFASSATASTIPSSSASNTTVASSSSPALEKVAGDVIRRINDSARDREGQVRALWECERELRKIGGEVGGDDVLGSLDELEGVDELLEELHPKSSSTSASTSRRSDKKSKGGGGAASGLSAVEEDDWEAQMDHERLLGDADDDDTEDVSHDYPDADGRVRDDPTTPSKDTFAGVPAPPPAGPPTPAAARAELAYLRALTGSLVASLSAISEATQVTGASAADAGRRLRALKTKMGGVQADWEGAERSRVKIERWEAGVADVGDGTPGAPGTPSTPGGLGLGYSPATPGRSRRIDGRKIVAEHLQAFELALNEAASKTKLIMAAVA